MGKLKFGWAEEVFCFEKPIPLGGQFAERISEYEEKPLTATALAMESDGQQAVICGTDLLSVSCTLLDAVRMRLNGNPVGLDPEKVILSAIHTHTGPAYSGFSASRADGGSVMPWDLLRAELPPDKEYVESTVSAQKAAAVEDEKLLQLLADAIARAVLRAWENRSDGGFVNAFGRAAVGMCRRAVYSDGSAQMWGDTNSAVFTELEGGNDSGIELLYVFDADKKLTGIVANLACPAQCVQHRLFISPDFWGEVKQLVRESFGGQVFLLPLCSAAGDQCPVDLIRWVEPESDVHDPNLVRKNPPARKADPSMFDLKGMKTVGRRVANEIVQVYKDGLDDVQTDAVLLHAVQHMRLPLRRATLSEEKAAREAIRAYLQRKEGNVDFNDVAHLHVFLGILERMRLQERINTLDTEVHVIRLGNIAIATNPFELFLDYGNQIRARSKAEQTILIQLANGYEGYLPTEKAERGGHYSAFLSSGKVGHIGGTQLVNQTLDAMNGMFR